MNLKKFIEIFKKRKILRSIERELEVKEALFLLLLQKREEAAINYAVVKPSIKIIDSARTSLGSKSPNTMLFFISFAILGFIVPFAFLNIKFFLDTKIHTRKQLGNLVSNIPIIGEIPHIENQKSLEKIVTADSRDTVAESIRMVIANLNFVLFDNENSNRNNLILVTSSIKGEGKTIISANLASLLSIKYKNVLLVGADLRNPQIHRYLSIDKSVKGLTDCIYKNIDYNDFIIKKGNLDILLSGTIPPNPTELLSSKNFKNFIENVAKKYDYVIIDSAPCLLVSDTFEISKFVDTTLYVVRSNFSDTKLTDFINESKTENKLSNINLIFNGVGNSGDYGYKYGYQYGYKYGYKYGYNYGYGYGYTGDS